MTPSQLAADRGQSRAELHGLVYRACHALSDAFDDRRRCGLPVLHDPTPRSPCPHRGERRNPATSRR